MEHVFCDVKVVAFQNLNNDSKLFIDSTEQDRIDKLVNDPDEIYIGTFSLHDDEVCNCK